MKNIFLILLLLPTMLQAKLSTKEKISISACAAGIALGACYLADALDDDIDRLTSNQFETEIDDLLDDIYFFIQKIQRMYWYELKLAKKYKNTYCIYARKSIEYDLIDAVKTGESLHYYKHRLKQSVVNQLKHLNRKLESEIEHLFWDESYTLALCKKTRRKLVELLELCKIILKILDHQTYDELLAEISWD